MSFFQRVCMLARSGSTAAVRFACAKPPLPGILTHRCTLLQPLGVRSLGTLSVAPSHPLLSAPAPCLDHRRWKTRKATRKRPPTKPLSFAYGGDKEWTPLATFANDEPKPGFENIPELEAADERVQRIFSMGFADGEARMKKEMEKVMEVMQEHPADVQSLESRIARRTVHIRHQISHCLAFRKDKKTKVKLVEGLQARKKLLKELRKLDKEKYDWLSNELKLSYIPPPLYTIRPNKKQERKQAAREACWAIIDQKMVELKEKFKEEKEAYLEYKEKEMASIEQELKELGIDMAPTIEETLAGMNLGREVFPKFHRLKRRRAVLETKFKLYGIQKRKRGPDPRVKFSR